MEKRSSASICRWAKSGRTRLRCTPQWPEVVGPIEIPTGDLRYGTNVLAAELHGTATDDTDLALDMALQARVDSLVMGPVVVTTPPADLTVRESEEATFAFKGVGGAEFQWKSNGVEIAGATNVTYSLPLTPLSADGARYSVVVIGLTNSDESIEAELHVLPDTNAPTLVSAYLTGPRTITVTFSEPITPDTASRLANYAISNSVGPDLKIQGVYFDGGSNVVLTVSWPSAGAYTIIVSHIRDASIGNNAIIANSRVTVGAEAVKVLAIDADTLWRYQEGVIDFGTTWKFTNYNDSGWKTGAALFDAKQGQTTPRTNLPEPVRTVLPLDDETGFPYPTYYFRTRFNVPVLGPGVTLSIRHIIDDGAAFYLNGGLLYAIGLDTVILGFATRSVDTAVYEGPFNLPITNLVAGTNLLAVALKNFSSTSSDVTFGAELTLSVPSLVLEPGGPNTPPEPEAPVLFIVREGSNGVKLWWTNDAPFTLEASSNLPPAGVAWAAVTNQSNPYLAPATNGSRFYRLRY